MTLPLVSVVAATYARPAALRRLLGDLAAQTLPPESYEVIVVDDGSPDPAAAAVAGSPMPDRIRFIRRPNGGPGAARDHGARAATGLVLVFVDDDMRLPAGFLAAHLEHHRAGEPRTVVLGHIAPDPALATMPLFERFHAQQLRRFQQGAREGRTTPRGVHLCTGNVSLRLADYLGVGGFDTTLRRCEDRDLGIRLERAGCHFVFGEAAVSVHGSDHHRIADWRARSVAWGRADLVIARRHRRAPDTHPWRFWSLIDPRARPLVALSLAVPALGGALGGLTYTVARVADRLGRHAMALRLATLTYALDYFRGMRAEAGGLRALRSEITRAIGPRLTSGGDVDGTPASCTAERNEASSTPEDATDPAEAATAAARDWRATCRAVRADHDQIRALRRKYHRDDVPAGAIGRHLVRKVGFQMLALYRVMRWAHGRRLPFVAPVISRLIRHLYGAEIHWETRLAPGVAIVHGTGLVVSHAAVVGPGCVLFQGVTLGESFDAASGRVGAPRLEANVHVGPGATVLGPIVIGTGSKVMAGAVVTRDVPPGSLVEPPEARISRRQRRVAMR